MRDKSRIKPILLELQEIWEQNPDLRLGQLVVIATRPNDPCPEVFNIEDDHLLDGLRIFHSKSGA